ncbi:MAG: hypothetical protein GXO39_00315 [Thermotogae bacterium]|nr:hypothetical protein [Thermotogota bacterium]
MTLILLAGSNLPPWMTGPNVLYVGLYGYGATDYQERTINAQSFKTTYTSKGLSSSSAHFGGGAFVRWNTWGVNVELNEGYFYKWKPNFQQDTTYADTSFFQDISVTIAHYRNPYSWTYVGITVSTHRFAFGYGIPFPDTSSEIVKNSENWPIPNSEVRYLSMGISGRVYLEVENLYSEGKGFLPWVGGRVSWDQVSFQSSDPLGNTSGTGNTLHFEAFLGLDYYVQPWLGFFLQASYSSFESTMELAGINPGYRDYYDQVRVGYNNTSVRAGVRLTWYKERY